MPNPTIIIDGRLTRDPELRFSQGGIAIASISVATSDRRKNDQTQEWEDKDTSFWECSAWKQLAEHAAETLRKGDRVHITGILKQRSYETREGQKRTVSEVDVRTIGKDITPRRESSPQPSGGWAAGGGPTPPQSRPAAQPDPWGAALTDAPPF